MPCVSPKPWLLRVYIFSQMLKIWQDDRANASNLTNVEAGCPMTDISNFQ